MKTSFGKYAYSLFVQEPYEKIDTRLMSLCSEWSWSWEAMSLAYHNWKQRETVNIHCVYHKLFSLAKHTVFLLFGPYINLWFGEVMWREPGLVSEK